MPLLPAAMYCTQSLWKGLIAMSGLPGLRLGMWLLMCAVLGFGLGKQRVVQGDQHSFSCVLQGWRGYRACWQSSRV